MSPLPAFFQDGWSGDQRPVNPFKIRRL